MKEEQSKEHMIRDLQPVEAYRKRSLKPTAEEQSSERDSVSSENYHFQKKLLNFFFFSLHPLRLR